MYTSRPICRRRCCLMLKQAVELTAKVKKTQKEWKVRYCPELTHMRVFHAVSVCRHAAMWHGAANTGTCIQPACTRLPGGAFS